MASAFGIKPNRWRETKVVFKYLNMAITSSSSTVEEKQKLYLNSNVAIKSAESLAGWRETKVVFKYVYGDNYGDSGEGWRETKVVFK